MDRGHISIIERGMRDRTLSTQERIAKAFEMTVAIVDRDRAG